MLNLLLKKRTDNCIFNIILINNKEIRKINKEYRNIDKETDVITFALEDYDDGIKELSTVF